MHANIFGSGQCKGEGEDEDDPHFMLSVMDLMLPIGLLSGSLNSLFIKTPPHKLA